MDLRYSLHLSDMNASALFVEDNYIEERNYARTKLNFHMIFLTKCAMWLALAKK